MHVYQTNYKYFYLFPLATDRQYKQILIQPKIINMSKCSLRIPIFKIFMSRHKYFKYNEEIQKIILKKYNKFKYFIVANKIYYLYNLIRFPIKKMSTYTKNIRYSKKNNNEYKLSLLKRGTIFSTSVYSLNNFNKYKFISNQSIIHIKKYIPIKQIYKHTFNTNIVIQNMYHIFQRYYIILLYKYYNICYYNIYHILFRLILEVCIIFLNYILKYIKIYNIRINSIVIPHVFWHIIFKNIFFDVLINSLLHQGKKELMESLIYKLLFSLKKQTKIQPIFIVYSILETLQPILETYPITKSGKVYQIPRIVLARRRLTYLVRLLKNIVNIHAKNVCFVLRFVSELTKASLKRGVVYSKIFSLHRFSFTSRINLRFIRKRKHRLRIFS